MYSLLIFFWKSENILVQDEGYEEYRSLLSDLIDSNAAGSVPEFELTKRMQQLAEPVINKIADTAAHFIQ